MLCERRGLGQKEALFVVDPTMCSVDTYSISFDTDRQEEGGQSKDYLQEVVKRGLGRKR